MEISSLTLKMCFLKQHIRFYVKSLLLDDRPSGLCVDQQQTALMLTKGDGEIQVDMAKISRVILTTVGLMASQEEPIIYTWIKCT